MFKYASLLAVASASTVSSDAHADEAKASKAIDANEKKLKALYLKSTTHAAADLTIDFDKQTQADITAANHVAYGHVDAVACARCHFSGGTFSEPVEAVAAVAAVAADKAKHIKAVAAVAAVPAKDGSCIYAHDVTSAKDTDVATRWADLTYADLFNGLQQCAGSANMVGSMTGAVGHETQNGHSSFDEATQFPTTETFAKKTGLGASWDYTWSSVDTAADDSAWAYVRTVLPHSFAGGLLLSATDDANTHFALRIHQLTGDRYFDAHTVKATSLGKTGKVALSNADSIEVFWNQNAAVVAADSANNFNIKVERISSAALAEMVITQGGVIVWVVIGCVLLCLIIVGVILWKKCSGNKEEFYNADDLYARV